MNAVAQIPEPKPTSDPAACSPTCDWGSCHEPTSAWRWDRFSRAWLPVCAVHAKPKVKNCKGKGSRNEYRSMRLLEAAGY
jgi:hypothetical protein